MIPQRYAPTPDPAIASYDFFDISEGTGVKTFYLGTHAKTVIAGAMGSTGVAISGASLFQNEFYSKLIETYTNTGASTGAVGYLAMEFDLAPFQEPKIVDGTAYLELPVLNQSGTNALFIRYIALCKVDGATNAVTYLNDWAALSGSLITAGSYSNEFVKINISGATLFKIGDSIRLSFEGWHEAGSLNRIMVVGHDPKNRDGTYITPSSAPTRTTIAKLHVPFKII